jgi:hypothetical protein
MSAIGPSRHFVATHHFGRFQSEADIRGLRCLIVYLANDPKRTKAHNNKLCAQ